jgi:hypothetical protein
MGESYVELLEDRTLLQAQMQAYAASSDDADVRDVVRRGFGDLVSFVEQVSQVEPAELSRFMADGMLLNVVASMDLLHADERWARDLLRGCVGEQRA